MVGIMKKEYQTEANIANEERATMRYVRKKETHNKIEQQQQ